MALKLFDLIRWRFRLLCCLSWIDYYRNRRLYRQLDEKTLKTNKHSDTVFVFGSGSSIRDISDDEWKLISEHNTVSFSWFLHQKFVRVDYHLIREVCSDIFKPDIWKPQIAQYSSLIRNNFFYNNAIFVVQGDFTALNANRMIDARRLPPGAAIYRFRTCSRSVLDPPSDSFQKGIVHAKSSLFDAVNFAFLMGWKKIVLVGVDLYDRRYFWLSGNELRDGDKARGASVNMRHNTADSTINLLGQWKEIMAKQGVELMVYNPRSLLADSMPVFQWMKKANSK